MSDVHAMHEPRVHVIQTGRLIGNETFLRGEGWGSLARRRKDIEFPAYSFIVEHPEGHIAIDTGMSPRARSPRPRLQRRFVPRPVLEHDAGAGMRALGLSAGDVRRVILTHLDWDHAGGLAHFPHAEVLVHRPEWEFAHTFWGRQRYEPDLWPDRFDPSVYDLDDEPFGPFPTSRAVTSDGAVRLIPLPGHSIGQVGVIVRCGGLRLFFTADHVLRQDWFLEDYAAGRLLGLGVFFGDQARETSRRIHDFVEIVPTVLVPCHDDAAPERLARLAVTDLEAVA
jgi:glyoxylase-like metal-dependent hydrolase (beta-lactamase superfamily II)